MRSTNTYLKILLLAGGCLFTAGLYAAEEGMEEDVMTEDEGAATDEGATAEEGMEEEGMLEEEGEKLPPLYTSEVEMGIGYSTTTTFSAGAFKFGEYNGLEDDGAFAIGNLKLRKFNVIGDDDNDYWKFNGTNLGLDPRNVYGEYSHDGTYGDYSGNNAYRIFFEYDQIPHNQFEDGQTPFFGAGTTNQTLPPVWTFTADGPDSGTTAGDNTSEMANLLTSLKRVELETERQRFGGGVKWNFTDHWAASATYRHENKEGSDPIGAVFGSSGGNPRASVLAVPINYDFDEFNANLAYTGIKGQASLNYHLSLFDNEDTSVFWENPFDSSSWPAGSNHSDIGVGNNGIGRLSLFPDNQAHQVKFDGGYNFTPSTRGNATISYSRWLQDENFLPYSNIFAPATDLPRSSLDGDIAVLFTNVNLYSRLTNKLDVKGRYTYEDRDNNTPRDTYLRMQGEAVNTAQQPGPADDQARVNWNYGLTRHFVDAEAGYRITPMTKLQLGYSFERKERDYSEVDTTDEHTGRVRLSATPFDTATGWIKYSHSWLDGSDYIANEPVLTGHTQAHINSVLGGVCVGETAEECPDLNENDPLMRKYFMANRDRDRVQAAVNFYPTDKVDFTVNGEYRDDDYNDTEIGLQDSRHYNVTLDAGWHPTDRVNAYAFGTYEVFQYDQRGFRRTGSPALGPNSSRAVAGWDFWTTDTQDKIFMAGTGFDWFIIEDKFKMNLDFTYSKSITSFDQTNGPGLTGGNVAEQLPDVTTRLYNLGVTGEYKIRDNMKARLGYMYERYSTRDFGLDRVDPNTLSNVILLGQQSPDYVAHVFGISFIYDFQ